MMSRYNNQLIKAMTKDFTRRELAITGASHVILSSGRTWRIESIAEETFEGYIPGYLEKYDMVTIQEWGHVMYRYIEYVSFSPWIKQSFLARATTSMEDHLYWYQFNDRYFRENLFQRDVYLFQESTLENDRKLWYHARCVNHFLSIRDLIHGRIKRLEQGQLALGL